MKLEWTVSEDSDFWPCPEGCGDATEDEYGGPCRACWRALDERERGDADDDWLR